MTDTILGQVKRGLGTILDNPITQGIGITAAAGFNPAAGLLLAPILKNEREKRALKLEQRRANLDKDKLLIDSTKRRNRAIDSLPALLGPDPATVPIDANDALLPLPAELAASRKSQRDAELFGALTDIAPGASANALLQNMMPAQTKPPAMLAMLEALGLDPTLENIEALSKAQGKGGGGLAEQLDLIVKGLELQQLRTTIADDKTESSREQQGFENSVFDTLDTIATLTDANDRLEGSFLSPGSTALDVKRPVADVLSSVPGLNNLFGQDFAQQVEDLDVLRKSSADLVSNLIESMNAAGIPVTRSLQRLQEQSSASDEVSPGAITSILKTTLRQTLRAADQNDVKLTMKEREKYETLLERLDNFDLSFNDAEEAMAAFDAGNYQVGDVIFIGGERITVEDEE